MPRKNQALTVEQINEFLSLTENELNETIRAVRDFLRSELVRRKAAGNTGGRPKRYEGTAMERNPQAAAKYYRKIKKC